MSSRKWERMVYRNQQKVNEYRKRAGRTTVNSKVNYDLYTGRSILLPVLFIGVGLLYGILYYGVQSSETMYWITFIAYLLLGIWFFAFRKPYLKVSKTDLATRKWGRERVLNAKDIEFIQVEKHNIVIKQRSSDKLWVFSKVINLFDIPAMADRLREFALKNQIKYINLTK
ncbi:hypothetical protein PRECH8_15750 [Insulibacter thermoxylanivorax]|uniref:Uncharacterized protein n=1 Tax=Insulibacter thermoxylanivorax TaxID=2749268 RepID=A0A916QES4_9BACL|nr:methyltransferase [Insulibacter thermoxylanivorax]GFR38279.1 hypothetical protein PRECH8_15750 [Insulibacter thermoxylanivorax]